jgi:hypothetical protein
LNWQPEIMKKLFIFLAVFLIKTVVFGQDITVKSQELDRLIWSKINERLVTLGKSPIKYFEDSLINQMAAKASNRLIQEGAPGEHTNLDTLSWLTTGYECIYRKESRSSPASYNKYIIAIQSGDLDMLAQVVVDAWVSSPSHNEAISRDNYPASTVSTVIVYNPTNGTFRIAATWISMGDVTYWKPRSGYTWIF